MQLFLLLLLSVTTAPIRELMRMVYQKRENMQQQENKSRYAESVFDKSPEGRQVEDSLLTGIVWMKKEDDDDTDDEDTPQLAQVTFILNRELLYFVEKEKVDYRSVDSGIVLL